MSKKLTVALACALVYAGSLHAREPRHVLATGDSAVLDIADRTSARLDVREVNGFSIVFETEHLDRGGRVLSRQLRYLDAHGQASWEATGAAIRVYCVNGSGKIVASVGTTPLRRETGPRHAFPLAEKIAYAAAAAGIAGLWIASRPRASTD